MAAFNIQQSMRESRINTKKNNNQVNNNICFGRLESSRNTKRGFWACFSEKSKKKGGGTSGWKDRPKSAQIPPAFCSPIVHPTAKFNLLLTQGQPISSKAHCTFLGPTVFFPSSLVSLSPKKASRHIKNTKTPP
jgi:hypothetical protein